MNRKYIKPIGRKIDEHFYIFLTLVIIIVLLFNWMLIAGLMTLAE